MAEQSANSIDYRILSALDSCILKMSDALQKTIDPLVKESLVLFKQFCSAVNARRQGLKSVVSGDGQADCKKEQIQKMLEKKPYKPFTEPTWTETMLNKPNPNCPIQPTRRQNGLFCAR